MNTDLINEILLGGLLGILGQGIRIAVGLKKLHSSNVTDKLNDQPTDDFSTSRLLLSIFLGFIAGAITCLLKGDLPNDANKQFIITIMASGYAGADFIEGVFNTYITKLQPSVPSQNNSAANIQPVTVKDESIPNNTKTQG